MANDPATTATEALPGPRATAAPVWVAEAEGTVLTVAEAEIEPGTGVLDGLTDADGVGTGRDEATTVCACTMV